MTVEIDQLLWMRDQLARYTYRPGWKMRLDADAECMPVLVVDYQTADSRNPERICTFQGRRALGPFMFRPIDQEQSFGEEVAIALQDIEKHESREWLRRDGVLFDDPHADPSRWNCAKCGGVGPIRHEGNSWTCPGCHTKAEER